MDFGQSPKSHYGVAVHLADTGPPPHHADSPGVSDRLRPRVAWPTLIVGIVLVGVGLGLMIDADFGVAPVDAFFTAVSRTTGLSVGVVLALMSVLMVLLAWALGVRPALGTLISFLGIALVVDLTRAAAMVWGAPEWPWTLRVLWWIAGLVVFCAGVASIFAANRGVSPYDLLTQTVSLRTGVSLGVARLMVDAVVLIGAIALGGSWGVGTVVILIAVPVTLNVVLPKLSARLQRISAASPPAVTFNAE